MKKKQTLAVLLAAAMVLSMPVGAYAEELTPEQGQQQQEVELFGTPDADAPVLNGVSIDKTEVKAGESFTLTLDVTEKISGLNYIQVTFVNETTGKNKRFSFSEIDASTSMHSVTCTVPVDEAAGIFRLKEVTLMDVQGNQISYYDGKILDQISVTITNGTSEDKEAPTITNVSVSPNSVSAPGEVTLTIGVKDDVSGVNYANVEFVNRQTGHKIEETETYSSPVTNGTIEVKIPVTQYDGNGIYELNSVQLMDANSHLVEYSSKNEEYPSANILPQEVSFTITNNGTEDITPPVLESISVDKTEIEAPGTVTLTLKVSDEPAGYRTAIVDVVNTATGNSKHFYSDRENPSNVTVNISQFEPSGVMRVDTVYLFDNNNNMSRYDSIELVQNTAYPLPQEATFLVKNIDETSGDIVSATTSPDLVDEIDKMAEGNTAHIYHGNNDVLSKDVFGAIAGKNKTIAVESDGIQWIFEGEEIDESKIKDINLGTTIEEKWFSESDVNEEIAWEQNAVVLQFADNGDLPGKATIRVKIDPVFKDYIGTENLYVYYYDNTTKEFKEIAAGLNTQSDGYIEFTITHNSDFVITSGPIKTQEGENPDNSNPPVNPGEDDKPVTPSTPSNPTTPSRPNSSTTTAPGTPINYESEKPDPADEQAVEAYNFWQNTKREIRVYERAGSLRVYVPADVTYMPASVMETLRVENVPVVLQWQGHRIEIPAGKAQPKQPLKAYWPMKTLCELYNA